MPTAPHNLCSRPNGHVYFFLTVNYMLNYFYRAQYILFLLPVFFFSGCMVGPDFKRIETAVDSSQEYLNFPEGIEKTDSLNAWWQRIDDPVLDSYISELLSGNLALREAGERIIQARETVLIRKGELLPDLNLDTTGQRSFSAIEGERVYTTSLGVELNTSWEIDLWGKLRRQQESAEALFNATSFDREALIHSLIAELLNRRVAIAVNIHLLELAQKNQENRKTIYELTKRRHELGVRETTLADVFLAEENFTSVRAEIFEFQRLLTEEIYRLDVLLGHAPGYTDPAKLHFPLLPPPLDAPVSVPAKLLDRRPDLQAAEFRLQSATAEVGVAVADLYPSVNLGAGIGYSGDEVSNVFTADQLAGSIFGNIMTRLFNGGALRANIRIQESEVRELAASYSNNVLDAIREVETALNAERELTEELVNVNRSVISLKTAEKLLADRYIQGTISLRELLDTQQRRYTTEQLLLQKQREKWSTRISLYLALGGDWLGNSDGSKNMLATQNKEASKS